MEWLSQIQSLRERIPYYSIKHRPNDKRLRWFVLGSLENGTTFQDMMSLPDPYGHGKWRSKATAEVMNSLSFEDMIMPDGSDLYPRQAYLFDMDLATTARERYNNRLVRHTYEHAAKHATRMAVLQHDRFDHWFALSGEAANSAIELGYESHDWEDLYGAHIHRAKDLFVLARARAPFLADKQLDLIKLTTSTMADAALIRTQHLWELPPILQNDQEALLRREETQEEEDSLFGDATQIAYDTGLEVEGPLLESLHRGTPNIRAISDFVKIQLAFLNGLLFCEAYKHLRRQAAYGTEERYEYFWDNIRIQYTALASDVDAVNKLGKGKLALVLKQQQEDITKIRERVQTLEDIIADRTGVQNGMENSWQWLGMFNTSTNTKGVKKRRRKGSNKKKKRR